MITPARITSACRRVDQPKPPASHPLESHRFHQTLIHVDPFRLILEALSESGRLIGIDKDPVAVDVGRKLSANDSRFEIEHASFVELKEFLSPRDLLGYDGVLVDLGSWGRCKNCGC